MLRAVDTPKLLTFPCAYPIKVMMRADEAVRARVNEVLARHAEATAIATATERPSAQGNFRAVTYTIHARDEQHIAALFAELKNIDGVLLVL
jgi:putative lipoic acid-binding regulatory protein